MQLLLRASTMIASVACSTRVNEPLAHGSCSSETDSARTLSPQTSQTLNPETPTLSAPKPLKPQSLQAPESLNPERERLCQPAAKKHIGVDQSQQGLWGSLLRLPLEPRQRATTARSGQRTTQGSQEPAIPPGRSTAPEEAWNAFSLRSSLTLLIQTLD